MNNRVEMIAAACYQALFACAAGLGESIPPWTDANDETRSNVYHAIMFYESFDCRNLCTFDELCQATHIAWREKKKREGWRHGLTLDPQNKEHPGLTSFDQLPPAQRLKYSVFARTYLALRRILGEPHYR